MEHYQVILAYDGSEFQGFQRQANTRTIQGVVEDALRRLGWQGQKLLAAGRTDAGVHATGQVVAFDLDWQHPTQALLKALNANLPASIAARQVKQVSATFHPRYDADWRRYIYQIISQPVRHPLRERYAWRVWPAVDLSLLQQTAAQIIGTHDFAAFGAPLKRLSHARSNTVRTVFQAGWIEDEQMLFFEITANAYLYHMVRRLVHMQVMIAQGRLAPQAFDKALEASSRELPKMPLVHGLAPAQGLILAEVHYPPKALGEAG